MSFESDAQNATDRRADATLPAQAAEQFRLETAWTDEQTAREIAALLDEHGVREEVYTITSRIVEANP